jgi:hypothetical protein
MYGGSFLGTQKQLPDNLLDKISAVLTEYKIHGLLIIGGFEVCFFIINFNAVFSKSVWSFQLPKFKKAINFKTL